MTFQEFINITSFSPTYAARKMLYEPTSRPAKMAEKMGVEALRSDLVWMASGRKSLNEILEKNNSSSIPASPSKSGEIEGGASCTPANSADDTPAGSINENKPGSQREVLTSSSALSLKDQPNHVTA